MNNFQEFLKKMHYSKRSKKVHCDSTETNTASSSTLLGVLGVTKVAVYDTVQPKCWSWPPIQARRKRWNVNIRWAYCCVYVSSRAGVEFNIKITICALTRYLCLRFWPLFKIKKSRLGWVLVGTPQLERPRPLDRQGQGSAKKNGSGCSTFH